MSDAVQKMKDNIVAKYGKKIADWIDILNEKNFEKHGQAVNFLKKEHGFTHGYANLLVHEAKQNSASHSTNVQDLIVMQYKGKEHFKPIYDELVNYVSSLGPDVEIAPKKSYVSLRRDKQFACLKPSSKVRFEVGLNLKDQDSSGNLEKESNKHAMFTHRIRLQSAKVSLTEVKNWLSSAYEKAGK